MAISDRAPLEVVGGNPEVVAPLRPRCFGIRNLRGKAQRRNAD